MPPLVMMPAEGVWSQYRENSMRGAGSSWRLRGRAGSKDWPKATGDSRTVAKLGDGGYPD